MTSSNPEGQRDYKNMVLDARPDRMDFRDREYRPHLESLPQEYPQQERIKLFLPCYKKNELILDQGKEGACTGYGLAATINYLIWQDKTDFNDPNGAEKCDFKVEELLVSELMLYHMARVYDEWDGEDYSGSSCRGAMKGWHRHGVCKRTLWNYNDKGKFKPPKSDGWADDALSQPLGAYYRINHESIVDMQAAIKEVGAIYCSAEVHRGWWLDVSPASDKQNKIELDEPLEIPILTPHDEKIGGHAFCIIGYNNIGFIVQNSWGDTWGWNGFAVMKYADWVANGNDAWVVSRGVPVENVKAPRMFANNALYDVATKRVDPAQSAMNKALKFEYGEKNAAKPWTEDEAYAHALVISNNGRPKHTVIAAENSDESAKQICYTNIEKWLNDSDKNRKIAVYAHGGLNDEESSINRVRIMAPYFKANGIYPLFIIWKTGLGETLSNIVNEAIKDMVKIGPAEAGWTESLGDWLSEKTDRAIETVARGVHAKGLWSEMKENAVHASDRAVPGFVQNKAGKPGAMVHLAAALEKLAERYSNTELHMVGHSAGSILLGAWLNEIQKRKHLSVKTVSLFAPACTIDFANKTYKKAIEKGILKKNALHIHNMDDEREKADNTGKVYRKSLLYLVSRALEDVHKMPILGLQAAWDIEKYDQKKSGGFHVSQKSVAKKWNDFAENDITPITYSREDQQVKINTNSDFTNLSHGSFDNDIEVIEFTLKKIKGSNKLKVKVVNLCGY